MTTELRDFPDEFLFGTSTSSHQVEGNNRNQWSRWEEAQATRLASQAGPDKDYGNGSGSPIWTQVADQAKYWGNYVSGAAADHFHRYEEDLDLARELGLTAYRFSLEWSRIEPSQGQFDREAIEHYRRVIRAVKARGMEPFVTFWHWTEPLWFTELGGWENPDAPAVFAAYVARVMLELGREATFWITLNEPEVYSGNSYQQGVWPPQKKSLRALNTVNKHLVRAHQLAYPEIKAVNPNAQVGAAINNVCFQSAGGIFNPIGTLMKVGANLLFNNAFRKKILDTSDWLGFNYYMRWKILFNPLKPYNRARPEDKSDLGWELYPKGMYKLLKKLGRFGKPIYITENGLADRNDDKRAEYIRQTLSYVAEAMADGVDVRGYFHWSLLDNFEWDKGYWPEFGLIHVDRRTLKRTIRQSAWAYALIIRTRFVHPGYTEE